MLFPLLRGEMYLQVSLVDLCADAAGWDNIDQLDRYQNFITRTRKRATYAEIEEGNSTNLQDFS
ncbi:hypothetical protein KSC_056900 [Ktedonobacter sp. SOSP1-52]|nr:hypothetical protein KSC_056900 [Ktedonobacter sp. SOSP1-52]